MFSITAITGFKQPSMNCYQKPLMSISQRPKSLSRQRSSRAPSGDPKRGKRARLGEIILDFASLNTLVLIWVYPEANTDLQPNLLFLQKGKVSADGTFKVTWRTEGTNLSFRDNNTGSSLQSPAVVLHLQTHAAFLQMLLRLLLR